LRRTATIGCASRVTARAPVLRPWPRSANPAAATHENAAMDHPLDRLFATIAARKDADASSSYTAKLLQAGVEHCAKKFGEEAVETALASVLGNRQATIAESADVLYHLLVLWAASGIAPDEVYAALAAREGVSGLEEKATRRKS
jgi:phosphoribosyl-ATP pyrophosphohydrolase